MEPAAGLPIRIYPWQGLVGGGGGYFATLPAREGGVLPALAVPSHPSATSVSHQFPGRDL